MGGALDVLVAIMRDSQCQPGPRVSAARAVLECGLKLAELVTLAERVSELEKRLGVVGGDDEGAHGTP